MNPFKNPNHVNKISNILPEIWLPNLQYFLVTYLCHIRRFKLMVLTENSHFCIRKGLLSNYCNLFSYLNQLDCATFSYP